MRLHLRKSGASLIPVSDQDAAALGKWKTGDVLSCDIKQPRNIKLHRKWFALATLLFEIWEETCEPQEYKGVAVEPNFERFRHDLTILAGYYDPVFAVNGEVRLEAKSLSFGSMSAEDFEALFSATINVGLRKIVTRGQYDEATLRQAVDEVLSFT